MASGLVLAAILALPDAGGQGSAATPSDPAALAGASAPAGATLGSLLKRGDAAFAQKDYRSALFAWQDAIRLAPANVEARSKAGQAYARMGHDDEAIEQWTVALKLDPQNAIASEGLTKARERRAALGQDDSGAHYTKGVALVRDRKFSEGVAELDRALAQKPDFAVALVARGSARVGQGRYEEALADYTAAQRADSRLASPLLGLAEAYRGLGQKEKAAQFYRQFAQSNAPDAQAALKDYALQTAQALAPR